MKKIFFLFLLINTILFANIGKVTASKGEVSVTRATQNIQVTSGMDIEKKDKFTLKENGKAQLRFNDGTVITLGKNTNFSVESYFQDDVAPKATFNVTKGIFRAITGRIGKIAPDKFKLKVKSATIGIRGTIFAGQTVGDTTNIACTQGAISVTVDGKIVDVDAGQMVVVTDVGDISTPKAIESGFLKSISTSDKEKTQKVAKKIVDTIMVNENLSLDKEKIKEIVNQITDISNAEAKTYLEALLNDSLYASFHQVLDGQYYKVTPPSNFQTGYNNTDAYSGIVWGFYTQDKVAWSQDNFEEKIALATPVQTWMKTYDGEDITSIYTPTSTIASYIGYTDDTGNFSPNWEWNSGTRKLGVYKGKVIAVSDYNTIFDANNLPTDNSLLSAISADTSNETDMRVDYGSKSFNALIKFNIANKANGGKDTWYVYVVGTGEAHVTPSELKEVAYIAADGSEALSSAEFTFRYLGENSEQIVSTFNFHNNNESRTYGNLVFNNLSLIDLSAQKVTNDTNFEWGYWANGDLSNKTDEEILAQNPNGGWVKPINGLTQTDANYIAILVKGNSQLAYNGNLIGTVYDTLTQSTALMKNGTVNFNFDFSTQTYGGNIAFEAGSDRWDMHVNNLAISGSAFSTGGTSTFSANSAHNAGTPFYGEINGKFYGNSAQNVAGGFEVMSLSNNDNNEKNIKTAIGAFSGHK